MKTGCYKAITDAWKCLRFDQLAAPMAVRYPTLPGDLAQFAQSARLFALALVDPGRSAV
jgi:hypothetical protein